MNTVTQCPPKVLHVLSSLDETYGGPLRLVLDLSARAEGPQLSSQIVGIGDFLVSDYSFDKSRIHSLRSASKNAYAYSSELRPWLQRNLPEFHGVMIHGAWTYPTWATATECIKAGIPYAHFPHGMLEHWAVWKQGPLKAAKKAAYWHWRERFVSQNARCTFFTTNKERTRQAFPIHSQNRILRPYGFDSTMLPNENPDNMSLHQATGSRVALFLGRLHPKKNIDFLIRTWREAEIPAPWRLVIAGSGEAKYEAELKRIAKGAPSDSIQFAGFVSGRDKRYLLRRADWFLLPSLQENFGIAVLEAVEQNCAVALSEQVYIAESFRPESEILPLSSQTWKGFFRTRMQDTGWRNEVCARDRAHLLKTFSMDRIVQQWAQTCREVFMP